MTDAELQSRLSENARQHMTDDCLAFDALLRVTLNALKTLQEVETTWRRELRERATPFDPESDVVLLDGYRKWLEEAQVRRDQLAKQESLGCKPPSSLEFLQSLEAVEDQLSMRGRANLGAEARRRLSASAETLADLATNAP
jgi:hypothetical protein